MVLMKKTSLGSLAAQSIVVPVPLIERHAQKNNTTLVTVKLGAGWPVRVAVPIPVLPERALVLPMTPVSGAMAWCAVTALPRAPAIEMFTNGRVAAIITFLVGSEPLRQILPLTDVIKLVLPLPEIVPARPALVPPVVVQTGQRPIVVHN